MPNAKSFADALASSPAASLLQRVAHSAELAKVIKAAHLLPPSFDPCAPGICELRDGVLWLSARSPAEAAKLRQALPGLLKLLLRNGFEVIELRVRLQPDLTAYQRPASSPAPSAGGVADGGPGADPSAPLAFAEKLSLTLPPSPLRDATQSLANTLRSRTAKR